MKTKIILAAIICILFFLNTYAQDNSQNYISIHTKTDSQGLNELVEIQYFDGLGRPVQKTLKSITPTGKDLVTKIEYDYCGRVTKTWLPCPLESSVGFINMTNYSNSSKQFYGDDRPYTENRYYEGSWYDKVIGEQMPGADLGSHFKIINRYPNLQNSIIKFTVKNGLLERSGYYAEKTLIYTSVTDEDGKISLEYKDKQDRVIMKRSDSDVDTYFIYNDLGQLTYIIPPIAVDNLKNFAENTPIADSNDYLKKYCYLYKYDECGNCIYKRLPGCDPIYMVYDKANRLILSQDGNQRVKNQWSITKYDMLGRILYTGIINRAVIESEQTLIHNNVITESEGTANQLSNTGYTCNWFGIDVIPLSVNYYDNYNFLDNLTTAEKTNLNYVLPGSTDYGTRYTDSNGNVNAKGLLTGTRVYILDNVISSYLATAIYYDEKGQIVQSRSTNQLGGYDFTCNGYNFNGQIIQSLKQHNIAGQATTSELYANNYDQTGRLLKTTYKVNNKPEIILVDNSSSDAYDELGRLHKKKRHNTADIEEFDYNIRNWTTRIKSGEFEEKLYYNTNLPEDMVQPCYNGNISATTWKYNGSTNGYIYYYDNLNRLVSNYSLLNNVFQVDNQYSESFNYDKHGNITYLNRYGNDDLIDQLTLTYAGNQLKSAQDGYSSQNIYSQKEYQDKVSNDSEMAYDANGNLIKDLDRDIVTIKYNLLNLPEIIQFKYGNQITNVYDALGNKLSTRYITIYYTLPQPLNPGQILTSGNDVNMDETVTVEGIDYIDNFEYSMQRYFDYDITGEPIDSRYLSKVYNDEGYATNLTTTYGPIYNYYRKDHLGNNREVWQAAYIKNGVTKSAATIQRTQYYPSGLPWASNTGDNPAIQPYKFNGKEFIEMHGLDVTDLGNRGVQNATNRFTSMDRFCEKFPWQSPYVHAGNNPVKFIDIMGDSTYRFDTYGKYLGLFDTDQNGIRGVIGYNKSYKDKKGNFQTMFITTINFTFNDPTFDVFQLSNMKVGEQGITIFTEENMNALMENSDIFSAEAQGPIDRYRFALNEYNGGRMDYSQRYFRHAFNVGFHEDGVGGFIIFGNSLKAYNLMDAGNFMWGQSMKKMGFYYTTAQFGSQYNENFHDAIGDQKAIKAGYSYQINTNRAIMNSIFLTPQLSGRIKSKYYK